MAFTSKKGYPFDIFEVDLKSRWLCNECGLILRNPCQLDNGNLYCRKCLPPETRSFRDGAVGREVNGLPVHCPRKPDGCVWKGELKALDEHMDNECTVTPITEEATRNGLLAVELPTISEYTLTKTTGYDVIEMEGCAFNAIGCDDKHTSNVEKESHQKSSIAFHLTLLMHYVLNLEMRVSTAFNDGEKFSSVISKDKIMEIILNVVNDTTVAMRTTIAELARSVQLTDLKVQKWEKDLSEMLAGRDSMFINKEPIDDALQKIQGLQCQVNATEKDQLAGNVMLQDLSEKANENHDKVKVLESSVESLFSTFRDFIAPSSSRSTASGSEKIVFTQAPCLSPELPAMIYPPSGTEDTAASFNGIFIWKIPKVAEMRMNAIRGKCRSFYSPPFFTGYRGYKVCGRLFLDGDGLAKGSHMSLFVAILRGPYDAVLEWPFSGLVRLALLDQTGQEHHVDSFLPDPNSSSFQRPVGSVNKASGSPMFFPLSDLVEGRFVKDDTMFIKITVETKELW